MSDMTRSFFRTAYGVMAVTIAQYVLKVGLKGGFGALTHSPVFTGDAWHQVSDIFQALLVIVGVWLSRRPPSREYPLGWRGLDAVGTLFIGLSLAYVAVVDVLVASARGVVSTVPWLHDRLGAWVAVPDGGGSHLLSGGYGGYAVAIMLLSAGVSLAVGRFQVRVGRETGHASVSADGEETLSDGRVELFTAVGIALQYAFQAPWLEYLLGFGMAAIMLHTASEILGNARGMILNRSLDPAVETRIGRLCAGACGVDRIVTLATYRRGPYGVIEAVLETRLGARGRDDVRRVLSRRIADAVRELTELDASVTVRFVPPDPRKRREAFLARRDGETLTIVGDARRANVLVICEVEDDAFDGCYEWPVSADALCATLLSKRVSFLRARVSDEAERTVLVEAVRGVVKVIEEPSSNPSLLGIPLD